MESRKTRKFGDMNYKHNGYHTVKSEAMSEEKKLREDGFLVRVVKHKGGYCIYTHSK